MDKEEEGKSAWWRLGWNIAKVEEWWEQNVTCEHKRKVPVYHSYMCPDCGRWWYD